MKAKARKPDATGPTPARAGFKFEWPHGLFIVLFLWVAFCSTRFAAPYRSLAGLGSDHISHIASALMFWEHGYSIYIHPASELLPHSEAEAELATRMHWEKQGVFVRPNDPRKLPLFINWPTSLRAYPPGDPLIHAPLAALYSFGVLSLDQAAQGAIILYALVAMLAAWLIVKQWFGAEARAAGERSQGDTLVLATVAAVVIYQLFNWGLEGFYDCFAVLLLLWAFVWYQRGRWSLSILLYCCAAATHFRTFWYAALPIAALWHLVQDKREGRISRLYDAPLIAAVIPAALALSSFAVSYAHIGGPGWHIKSALYFKSPQFSGPLAFKFVLATLVVVAFMAWRKEYLAAAIGATFGVMFFTIPQMYYWHSVALVPFVFHAGRRLPVSNAVVPFVFYVWVTNAIFEYGIINMDLVGRMFQALTLGKI